MELDFSKLVAGRDLDRIIAEHVLGNIAKDPDAWSENEEIWFWEHPESGMLIGEPYTFSEMGGMYAHQWRKFCPSTILSDAWLVIEHVRKLDKHWCPSVYWDDDDGFSEGYWVCDFIYYGESNFEFKERLAFGDTVSLAICRAALKVIFNINR